MLLCNLASPRTAFVLQPAFDRSGGLCPRRLPSLTSLEPTHSPRLGGAEVQMGGTGLGVRTGEQAAEGEAAGVRAASVGTVLGWLVAAL